MKKRAITVKPMGGLANRMRVLDSVFNLAQKLNYQVIIIWEKSFELNCSYEKLFVLPENVSLVETQKGRFSKRAFEFVQHKLKWMGIKIPQGYDYYLLFDDVTNIKDYNNIKVFDNVYIQTVHRFAEVAEHMNNFMPVNDLLLKINDIKANFSQYTLGVHIRRTDNDNSIKFSPTNKYFKYIDDEINHFPELKIYLATDSHDEVSLMNDKYPRRIIHYEKSLSRNTEAGICDALVDMYCLASTKKIIGSYYSSFSEVASEIGRVPLYQVYSTDLILE